jgi:hypothetical protein
MRSGQGRRGSVPMQRGDIQCVAGTARRVRIRFAVNGHHLPSPTRVVRGWADAGFLANRPFRSSGTGWGRGRLRAA